MGSQRTNCVNCGAPLGPGGAFCGYCGTFQSFRASRPWDVVLKNRRIRVCAIYPFLIVIGICIFLYIFGIAFDSLSETMLVRLTPLWFFFVVFGVYGYIAERLLAYPEDGKTPSYGQWMGRMFSRAPVSSLFVMLLSFPFAFLRMRNSLLVAFFGALVWGLLLYVFFAGIFPSL